MGNIFRGRELVEIGIQIERNGRDFYTSAAERSADSGIAELFGYLAGEEERHIGVFEALLETLEGYREPESYDGEYLAYMKNLAGENVLVLPGGGEEAAKRMKSPAEALDFAIGIEKDSIVFYLGMKKVVPRGDHRTLEKLVAEEEKHLRSLIEMKRSSKL